MLSLGRITNYAVLIAIRYHSGERKLPLHPLDCNLNSIQIFILKLEIGSNVSDFHDEMYGNFGKE